MQAVRGVGWVDVDAFGSLDEATLLAGFGDPAGNGKDDGAALQARIMSLTSATVPQRVQVLPARYAGGKSREGRQSRVREVPGTRSRMRSAAARRSIGCLPAMLRQPCLTVFAGTKV